VLFPPHYPSPVRVNFADIDIRASAHTGYTTHKFGLHASRSKGSLCKVQRSYSPITVGPKENIHISARATHDTSFVDIGQEFREP
jgi:hypothetical protein